MSVFFYPFGKPSRIIRLEKFIEFFKNQWAAYDGTKASARKIVEATLGMADHWGQDLNKIAGVTDFVTEALYAQQTMSMRDAIKTIIK